MLLNVRLRPHAADSLPVSPEDESAWSARAEEALALLQARPGFLRGWLGRSPDQPGEYLLAAEFESAGSLRRALSAADVRPVLWPLLADAADDAQAAATTYEVLARAAVGGALERLVSDLAPDAAEVRLGRVPQPPLER